MPVAATYVFLTAQADVLDHTEDPFIQLVESESESPLSLTAFHLAM